MFLFFYNISKNIRFTNNQIKGDKEYTVPIYLLKVPINVFNGKTGGYYEPKFIL